MNKVKFLVVFLMFFAFTSPAYAQEVNHFTSKVDNDVVMSKEYNASIASAGDSVNVDGIVHGFSALAGNKVSLDGETDYCFIAGNSITLNGVVNNDAFIAGNLITASDDAVFKRDAVIGGTDIELSGNFGRNVSLYGTKVTLKNVNIAGNVRVYAESIVINKDVVITGTLYYPEDSKYRVNNDASIGSVQKTSAIKSEDDENYFATVSSKIWSFLGLALVFAAISLFFPNVFNNINEKYAEFELSEAVEVFTKGLVVIILVPVVAVLLIFTMIGIPLGILLFLFYGISIYLTSIFTGYLIGYKIWQKIFDKDAHILLFGIIGLFILLILQLIPGVRILATIISVLVGLGLIFDTIKK